MVVKEMLQNVEKKRVEKDESKEERKSKKERAKRKKNLCIYFEALKFNDKLGYVEHN